MPSRAEPTLEQRFHALLEREGRALGRVAASYEADPARREDLLQEICLAIWRALPRFRGESSERTFIFRIAHNRGLTHACRRRPAEAEIDPETPLADPRPGPEARIGERERRQRLLAAVRALPLLHRQVLVLHLEELSNQEIADVMGISENNVAVRLTRARQALRARLTSPGGGG